MGWDMESMHGDSEQRWSVGGRTTGSTTTRRLALSFELRRGEDDRQAELWVYAEDAIRRWLVPTGPRGSTSSMRTVATELDPLPLWGADAGRPPRWDQGRCVIDANEVRCFTEAVDEGEVSFSLIGDRIAGSYRLHRTPMAYMGRPQWLIHQERRRRASGGRG